MKRNYLLLLLTVFALFSCDNDDDNLSPQKNSTLFTEMLKAMGGESAMNDATTISYNAEGISYEFQEDPEPVNGKVADFNYVLDYNLDGTQSKQKWSIHTEYAYESDLAFVEIIDNKEGSSEGITGFFSENFGGFGVQGDPMFSTKLAARQKTLMMSSPLALAKMISQNGSGKDEANKIKTGYNTSALGFGASTPDIELVIDPSTKLPSKAQVLENDPLLGDVLYEVVYSDWTEVNGLQVPGKLEHILDGNTIRIETLSNIQIQTSVDASKFTVDPGKAWPYDENEAKYGHLSSQFHFRTLMQTFAIDFPVEYVDQTSPLALPSETVANDPTIYRVSGDFQSHYTYAFKVGGELLLYDSPINNRRSAAVLQKIREDFSNEPIKYVVHSHNHFDHTGGVRGNLAEGGELIVGEGSKSFMENVLQRRHSVLSNPIEGKTVNVLGVKEEMTIGEGDEQIILYTIPSEHAEDDDYIVIYKPATKTLYFNDLYNAGFILVYDSLSQANQERLVRLAQELVNFVDSKGLEVTTYYCTHGFTTSDFDFQTVRELAQR